jgi:hypothetical protein
VNIKAADQRKQDIPRIYYQDNDPEFGDFDKEEGLDVDLDL